MSQMQNGLCAKELRELFIKATKLSEWEVPDHFPDRIEHPFFPAKENIFKAFELIAPSEVRYVILGQDPYPRSKKGESGEPIATGVAFGVLPADITEGKIHGSCAIYKVLAGIYGNSAKKSDRRTRYAYSSLEQWACKYKILMLNVALTVPAGKPGAHLDQWKLFTKRILEQVKRKAEDPKFISWGVPAAGIAEDFGALQVGHPSARSGSFAEFWTGDGECLTEPPRRQLY